MIPDNAHTHTSECPLCPGEHGRASVCDQVTYSRRKVRFIKAHWEAYQAAYLNPDPSSSSNELERLERERVTLPPRHICSCDPTHCSMCLKLSRQRPSGQDVGVEIGRGALINAPCPLVLMLDVEAGYAA